MRSMSRGSKGMAGRFAACAGAVLAVAVGCGTTSTASNPSPVPTTSPTQYDLELLTDVRQLGFTPYATPLRIDNYIVNGVGVNYDKTALDFGFGGLDVTEWHAVT